MSEVRFRPLGACVLNGCVWLLALNSVAIESWGADRESFVSLRVLDIAGEWVRLEEILIQVEARLRSNWIYVKAFERTLNRERAHHVVTELYLSVQQMSEAMARDIQDLEQLEQYLIRRIRELSFAELNRERRERYLQSKAPPTEPEELESLSAQRLESPPDPVRLLLAWEGIEQAHRIARTLSPQRYAVLERRFFQQKSILEIAKELGMSPKTVSNTLTEASRQFRTALIEAGLLAGDLSDSGGDL